MQSFTSDRCRRNDLHRLALFRLRWRSCAPARNPGDRRARRSTMEPAAPLRSRSPFLALLRDVVFPLPLPNPRSAGALQPGALRTITAYRRMPLFEFPRLLASSLRRNPLHQDHRVASQSVCLRVGDNALVANDSAGCLLPCCWGESPPAACATTRGLWSSSI